MNISDQSVLVIGGARGIGQAICETLLGKGAKLIFGDILEDEGNKRAEVFNQQYPGKVKFQRCSVANRKEVEDLFDFARGSFGVPSIVINTAGTIDETNKEHSRSLEVNVKGTIIVTDVCISRLGKSNGGNGGVLIHVASISGNGHVKRIMNESLRPEYWGPIYSASKHAIIAYTRSWALPENFTNHGIRMNTVCPSTIDTPFLDQVKHSLHPKKVLEYVAEMPDEIKLSPETVAKGMILLIEDDTKNGETLEITHEEGFNDQDLVKSIESFDNKSFTSSADTVAKGMILLIEDDTKNGETLVISHEEGFKYHQFTAPPLQ